MKKTIPAKTLERFCSCPYCGNNKPIYIYSSENETETNLVQCGLCNSIGGVNWKNGFAFWRCGELVDHVRERGLVKE